jgi:hypothetical protein
MTFDRFELVDPDHWRIVVAATPREAQRRRFTIVCPSDTTPEEIKELALQWAEIVRRKQEKKP